MKDEEQIEETPKQISEWTEVRNEIRVIRRIVCDAAKQIAVVISRFTEHDHDMRTRRIGIGNTQ